MMFNADQTRMYWTQQAQSFGLDSAASWSDKHAIELEIKELSRYLSDGQVVLDAGCANGFSTMHFANFHRLTIHGIDYIPEMIDAARERLRMSPTASNVRFDVGDITAISAPDTTYDRVIVTRVLINLQDEVQQRMAMIECARVLKVGGLLLLSEATLQGWGRLNDLRSELDLPPIPMPPFNRYIDQSAVINMAPSLRLQTISNFSSTYFVGTRVIKPLLIKLLNLDQDPADPDTNWNRLMGFLPAYGDYGTQKLFVFERSF